VQRHTQTSV